jgi:hypothetical protein
MTFLDGNALGAEEEILSNSWTFALGLTDV